jgi:hypothetical protein
MVLNCPTTLCIALVHTSCSKFTHSKYLMLYTTNLNVAKLCRYKGYTENILNLDFKNAAVRNNGGGFYN